MAVTALTSCETENVIPVSSDFEQLNPGVLASFEDNSGSWVMQADSIYPEAWSTGSGQIALLFPSGESKTLEFTPKTGQNCSALGFTARRLVNKKPFAFKVDIFDGEEWKTVTEVKEEMDITFTDFQFPVDSRVEKVRFASTTVNGSGLILDDFYMLRDAPMILDSIEFVREQLPVLKGKENNPVAMLRFNAQGVKDALSVTELSVNFEAPTKLEDIAAVKVLYTGTANRIVAPTQLAASTEVQAEMVFEIDQELKHGVNHIWVVVDLKDGASITHKLKASLGGVNVNNAAQAVLEKGTDLPQRFGIALRQAGDEGVPVYRIPGLVTSNEGTLIAVYDIRRDVIKNANSDLPNPVDVGLNRSTDGGETWEPMQVIMDMGNEDEEGAYGNGIGDPAVLVDRQTGTIWVMATWSHGDNAWNGSGPGFSKEETGQLMLVKSDDDGLTWSNPINITREVKQKDWHYLLQGPGRGITMADGTLVFAGQYQDETSKRMPHSTIIYSKDHGKTWKIGTGALPNTTEAQVVELEPGKLMLNMRDNRNRSEKGDKNGRAVYTTTDMGKTWVEHSSSHGALQEPTCMASLHKLTYQGKEVLLFSNPDSKFRRKNISIKASTDYGATWPAGQQVLLDERTGAGYSCLANVGEEHVGILYESSQAHLVYQLVPLKELLKN